MKQKIFFRADGNSEIGLGHVVRSLALADMLKDEFTIAFAIQNASSLIQSFIRPVTSHIYILPEERDAMADAANFVSILEPADLVVTDGYHFDSDYQLKIKQHGCKLICIDDQHLFHFHADAVINHAEGIKRDQYSAEPFTKFFLGAKYAMLRKPFLEAMNAAAIPKKTETALVCMGGSDVQQIILPLLEQLMQANEIKNIHAVTASSKSKEMLEASGKILEKTTIHYNLPANDLCSLIQKCDVAVTAASTIAYECCAVGIPLYTGYFVENQKHIYRFLTDGKLALPMGDLSEPQTISFDFRKDVPLFEQMIHLQRSYFNSSIIDNCKNIFHQLD